jgi:hypothetical protein
MQLHTPTKQKHFSTENHIGEQPEISSRHKEARPERFAILSQICGLRLNKNGAIINERPVSIRDSNELIDFCVSSKAHPFPSYAMINPIVDADHLFCFETLASLYHFCPDVHTEDPGNKSVHGFTNLTTFMKYCKNVETLTLTNVSNVVPMDKIMLVCPNLKFVYLIPTNECKKVMLDTEPERLAEQKVTVISLHNQGFSNLFEPIAPPTKTLAYYVSLSVMEQKAIVRSIHGNYELPMYHPSLLPYFERTHEHFVKTMISYFENHLANPSDDLIMWIPNLLNRMNKFDGIGLTMEQLLNKNNINLFALIVSRMFSRSGADFHIDVDRQAILDFFSIEQNQWESQKLVFDCFVQLVDPSSRCFNSRNIINAFDIAIQWLFSNKQRIHSVTWTMILCRLFNRCNNVYRCNKMLGYVISHYLSAQTPFMDFLKFFNFKQNNTAWRDSYISKQEEWRKLLLVLIKKQGFIHSVKAVKTIDEGLVTQTIKGMLQLFSTNESLWEKWAVTSGMFDNMINGHASFDLFCHKITEEMIDEGLSRMTEEQAKKILHKLKHREHESLKNKIVKPQHRLK